MGQPRDVRVHDHAGVDAERIAQNDIGGFASDAVEVRQFLHRARHLAVVLPDQFAATGLDVLRLVPKKARRPDGLLEFGERGVRVVRGRAVFLKNSAVTMFTRLSVHCAERMVAMSNSSGLR